jgi:plasmid stability protein
MGDLSIKNVPEAQIAALRARAERNHRSPEEGLRAVIDEVLRGVAEKNEKTMSISELSAFVQSLGMPTGGEATQTIREDRRSR